MNSGQRGQELIRQRFTNSYKEHKGLQSSKWGGGEEGMIGSPLNCPVYLTDPDAEIRDVRMPGI